MTSRALEKLETPSDWANERDFRLQLVQLLRARSWRVSFSAPSRPGRRAGREFMTMGTPGFPDLLCLRPPELVFLELKFYGKAPEPEQRVWLNGLAEVGGNVRAWCVDPGAWPLLVRLARDGIEAVEKDSGSGEALPPITDKDWEDSARAQGVSPIGSKQARKAKG